MKSTYIFLFGALFSSHSHAMEEDPNSKPGGKTPQLIENLIKTSEEHRSNFNTPLAEMAEETLDKVLTREEDAQLATKLQNAELRGGDNERSFLPPTSGKDKKDFQVQKRDEFQILTIISAIDSSQILPICTIDFTREVFFRSLDTLSLVRLSRTNKSTLTLCSNEVTFRKELYEDFCNRGGLIDEENFNRNNTLEKHKREKAKEGQLLPQDLYDYVALTDKTPLEIVKLALDGNEAKKQKEYLKAIPLLQETALYRYWPAMRDLGEICEGKKDFYNAYLWYTLSFQYCWIKTFKPSESIKKQLLNLCQTNKKKLENQLDHLNNLDDTGGFFSFYPESSQKEIFPHLTMLLFVYSKGFHEPYLTEGEKIKKAHLFNYIFLESFMTDPILRNMLGDDLYYKWGCYGLAAISYQKSGLPEALFNLGEIYSKGKLGESPNYVHAAYCYEKSSLPEGLYELGKLYEKGRLGERNRHEKAAYYYVQSNLPQGYFRIANLYYHDKLNQKGKYRNAAYYYEKASYPKAFDKLADLYQLGRISGVPDYQKAAHYYEKSKSPWALQQLGNLWVQDNLGEPDYQKAATLYERSGSPGAFLVLGQLYERGFLSKNKKPDYEKAEECYKKSNNPDALLLLGHLYLNRKIGQKFNYREAVSFFEQSGIPEGLHVIGDLYAQGFLSKNKNPNYQKAAEYYTKSQIPNALLTLAQFHEYGVLEGGPNYLKALKCFEASNHPYKDWMIMNMCRHETARTALLQENLIPEEIILQKKEALSKNCQNLDDSSGEKSFILGWLSLEDKKWEDAFIHFSHSLSQGEERARLFIDKLEKKFEKLAQQSKEASTQSELTVPTPNANLAFVTEEEENNNKDKEVYKKYKNKEEKKKEHSKRYIKLLSDKIVIPRNNKINNLFNFYSYEFLDTESEKNFRDFKKGNQKLGELLFDIQDKPWSTTGTGKPEVLKYGINIKGKIYKGCLSRRLNEEDRLVYKITGDRQILILSWKGHYE